MSALSALHFFPFYHNDWLSSPRIRRMTKAERGDFVDLLCLAMGSGTAEPSLEPDDLEGVSERIKAHWKLRDGRFYNEKLSLVWREAQTRHSQAVKRGKRSGQIRRQRKQLETVSKQGRNRGEQPPLGLGLETGTVSRDPVVSTSAVAPADAAPAAELPQELGVRSGVMTRLMDAMAEMGLKPRTAP